MGRSIVATSVMAPRELEAMMTEVTRRSFVSGILASAPALALASTQQAAPASDPVWGLIMSDLQRIYGELQADPSRRDSLRALESTIRTHVAYSASLGNPARIQRGLAAQLRNRRAEFLEEARRMSTKEHRDAEARRVLPGFERRNPRRADPTVDELESLASLVAKAGHVNVLMAAATAARGLSELKPQAVLRVSAVQWNPCDNAEAQIAALAFLTGMVCALCAVNPALLPECAALSATLAVMELAYFVGCTWL